MQKNSSSQVSRSLSPITLYVESPGGGGIGRVALRLAKSFIERGQKVDLLLDSVSGNYRDEVFSRLSIYYLRTQTRPSSLSDYLRSRGVKASRVWINPLRRPFAKRFLRNLYPSGHISTTRIRRALGVACYIRLRRPKTILALGHPSNMAAIYGRHFVKHPPPLIVSIHNNPEISYPYQQPEIGEAYPRADAIVCVSKGVAESVIRVCDLPQAKISVIYNPVPHLEIFRKSQINISHPWFIDGQIPVIYTAGRIDPRKDYHTLLSAFALVCKKRDARLVIMSNATKDEATPLLAQAENLGISSKFEILEFDPNPFPYMRVSSCFVLSSRTEGLPLTLVEAMACGTPVVSTDAPHGPREILENGKWGKLVAVGDSEKLACAILETISGNRKANGAALMKRAGFFSAERAANEYLSLVNELFVEKVNIPS